ncbi:hypothetical protein FVR03_12775 [Pontibacter qinzhouensis]|uniref:Uncharacterized protein n=1 Tax=Pontibacter qinzhouensis TaxID=2603253 RepID=A0A5C8K451_9BACT|nr:hypothetical protein [Pontibacter qinzhouensis]TXK45310.1 hypothetical protein FVR03_12775 [Pontibacter qinzhouensis]
MEIGTRDFFPPVGIEKIPPVQKVVKALSCSLWFLPTRSLRDDKGGMMTNMRENPNHRFYFFNRFCTGGKNLALIPEKFCHSL